MLKAVTIMGAFGTILIAIISGMVLSTIPDPNREIINSLPNTTPDIKTPANQALDVKDAYDSAKDMASLYKNIVTLLLLIGVPVGVIGGLFGLGRR